MTQQIVLTVAFDADKIDGDKLAAFLIASINHSHGQSGALVDVDYCIVDPEE